MNFNQVETGGNLKEMIKSAFDIEMPVDGEWGYSMESPLIIRETEMSLPQLEHTLASMRAHLEMSLMPGKEERYGSINLNESEREEHREKDGVIHEVTYTITAMKESDYSTFIDEYKENYGKDDFDLADHFKRRKRATLVRTETVWFKIAQAV